MSSGLEQLPAELQQQIKAELESFEHVHWVVQPISKCVLLSALPIWLFAVSWTVFAVFMFAMTLFPWFKETPAGTGEMIFGIIGPFF